MAVIISQGITSVKKRPRPLARPSCKSFYILGLNQVERRRIELPTGILGCDAKQLDNLFDLYKAWRDENKVGFNRVNLEKLVLWLEERAG